MGVPLSSRLHYRCVIEVTGPVEPFESHGAAWARHRDKAVPRALGPIHSPSDAQRFIEASFYNGRKLEHAPVIAIPVRVVVWQEGSLASRD